jgi:hypothetical protein
MSLIKQFVTQQKAARDTDAFSVVKQFIAGTTGRQLEVWAAENAETYDEHRAAKDYHAKQADTGNELVKELHKNAAAMHESVLEQTVDSREYVAASDGARRLSRLIHFRLA